MKTRGTGLLMVWTDIDQQYEAEFNSWYDEEHIAAMLEVPGILSAGRYRALEGGPKYLALYELHDHDVLHSAAYRDGIRYKVSPRRRQFSGAHVGRNFVRIAYRQIFPARIDPVDQPQQLSPFIQLGRMDMPAAIEEEFNAWYDTAYIPPYLEIPGCLGVRRFTAIEARPKYLTFYELSDPALRYGEAWDRARKSNPWSARLQPLGHDRESPAIYELIFAGRKPR